jgi:hypothetical protein
VGAPVRPYVHAHRRVVTLSPVERVAPEADMRERERRRRRQRERERERERRDREREREATYQPCALEFC